MKALGKQGDWESRTDAKVPAPGDIAARLGITEVDLCVGTSYEIPADGRPVQFSTSWEPYDLTAGTLIVLPEGGPHAGAGVVNRMAAIGVTVSHAVEQPEPRQATAEEASLLGIQKAALVTHIRPDVLQRRWAPRRDSGHRGARRSLRDRLRDPDQPIDAGASTQHPTTTVDLGNLCNQFSL